MKTTLKEIWSKNPCQDGWDKLVEGLGMSELKELSRNDEAPEDIEVSLRFILENNGWDNCKWAFPCVEGYKREFRLLAVAFARPVEHLTTDKEASRALDVAEQFANGRATNDELEVVAKAAAAAYDAAYAAADAETAAAYAAAKAASDAAYAAYAAAKAASDAASANPASAAASAARAAASAADPACDGRVKAIQAQISEFKRFLDCIESGERYEI